MTDTLYDPRGHGEYTDTNLVHDPWSGPRDPTAYEAGFDPTTYNVGIEWIRRDDSSDSESTTTREELSVGSSSYSDTHEELDAGIKYTVKHDGRIKARAVYVER